MGAQSCSRTQTKKAANKNVSTMLFLLLLMSLSSCLLDATNRETNDGRITSETLSSLESLAEAFKYKEPFQVGEAGEEGYAARKEGGEAGEGEMYQLKRGRRQAKKKRG